MCSTRSQPPKPPVPKLGSEDPRASDSPSCSKFSARLPYIAYTTLGKIMASVLVQHFFLGCLAHASYLVGSEGIAAVIDPQRDVDIYLDAAKQKGLKIEHIIETHLHADFVSGHHELAQRTEGRIYLGEGSGATFPHKAVKNGDSFQFGHCRLDFLTTPGHTVESICIAMTDLGESPRPKAPFTGDTLSVRADGRPHLSAEHTTQQLAAMLYHSLHDTLLKSMEDSEVKPAHGSGSVWA